VSDQAAILAIGGLTLAGVAGTVVLLTLDRLPKRLIAPPAIASFVRFGTLVRFLLVQSACRGLLLGSALLIHAAADDYLSQPIGGAGARVACAAIK